MWLPLGAKIETPSALRKIYNELVSKYGKHFEHKPAAGILGLAWTERPLRENGELAKKRRNLDLTYERSKDKASLLKRVRGIGLNNSEDEEALFSWAYIAERYAADQAQRGKFYWEDFEHRLEWAVLRGCLASVGKRPEYDMVRLRFLLETDRTERTDLIPLGRKLLRAEPKDEAVCHALGSQLARSKLAGDSEEALRIADKLLSTDPKRLQYIGLKASVFFIRYIHSTKPEDLESTLKWYRVFYQRAPLGSPAAALVKRTIAMLEKRRS